MQEAAYQQTRDLEERHWWFLGMRAIYRKQIETLRLPAGARILDLGCGTGGNLALLESFAPTWALDASHTAAAFVRGRGFPRIGVASATDLPLSDASVDLVTAFGVIEHVERDDRMLDEMYRVTKPGGHMLIVTSAHQWLWSVHDDRVHHKRRYRIRDLGARVRRAGWRVEQLSYVNSALFPGVAAVRFIQRLIPERPAAAEGGMSGFGLPPRPINQILARLLGVEGALLRWGNLPMGVGLVCRAVREAPVGSARGEARAEARGQPGSASRGQPHPRPKLR
ncbi:MAG: class I SAM-dependent methyltransferase [Gemmatimonadetes bacterium]|nr:class I SAM-dependent methyltransferase [Gemmatimonadota bacterium]